MPTISETIWDMKYRMKTSDGTPIDKTIEDTWSRVATGLASCEHNFDQWAAEFYNIMISGEFSPAGRIIAGAGTDRSVTLSNCFTMGTIPDSISGIFDHLKEAAVTMQQGGGIGYDFSTIRPSGAEVKGVAAEASGPLSFMDVWDAMCRTIMSAGSRRGAMMATMRCDHPDILKFIRAKRDPSRLRMFNLSVLITDDFMSAVKNNTDWTLVFNGKVYDIIRAVDLWNEIMQNTYDVAEPGVIFIDRINRLHNLWYIESVATTNPCGEKPMGPYASCLLGSIVIAMFVKNAFTKDASIDYERLSAVVRTAIRAMDNVIDVGKFPLPQQLEKAKADRQLGLGVMGLADALIMMGIKYGSEEAKNMTEAILYRINEEAYMASIDLAKEKGSFPNFKAQAFLNKNTFAGSVLPVIIKNKIYKYGIRNALLTSIAPTGTIALFAKNVSSGIEPVFAPVFTRKVLQPDGSKIETEVMAYSVQLWRDLGNDGLPPAFIDAQTITPEAHIMMQAAAQKYVDSSISKTANLPKDISFEDFKDVYMLAWDNGCKGCTTYRPNDVTGSVLSVPEAAPSPTAPNLSMTQEVIERPDHLNGDTYKIPKFNGEGSATYVTINNYEGRPFEMFLKSKNPQHQQWMDTVSLLTSAVMRKGGDISFLVEEFKSVVDPVGGAFIGGKFVKSIPAAIGDVLAKHMGQEAHVVISGNETLCGACGEFAVVAEGGCQICKNCGNSKCS